MSTALARRTDPATSHQASGAAYRSTAKDDVLRILTDHGPLHDRGIEIIHDAYVEKGAMPHRSAQRLRTARRELADAGIVRQHYDADDVPVCVQMPSGYASMVWEVAK